MRKMICLLILSMALILSACSGSSSSISQDTVKIDLTTDKNMDSNTNTDNSTEVMTDASLKEFSTQGTIIDINRSDFSIKINVNGTEQLYILNPQFQGSIDALGIKNGDTIQFTYTVQDDKLIISDITSIQTNGDSNSQSQGAGLGLLPKKPMVYDYAFVTSKKNLLIRESYLFTEDGFAQYKFEHEDYDDGKLKYKSTGVYYEDDTGYYRVEDIDKNQNPDENYISKVKNNNKQLLIKYPVKVGDEVTFNDNGETVKWVVEEYPSFVEGLLIFTDKGSDLIKIGVYKKGKKTNEWYYMPNVGMVRMIMTEFPDQPTTLQQITEID